MAQEPTDARKTPPQDNKNEIEIAIQNNPCGRCRAALLVKCRCTGGGGGGSGSESKDDDDKTALSKRELRMTTKDPRKQLTLEALFALLIFDPSLARRILFIHPKKNLTLAQEEEILAYYRDFKIKFEQFKDKLKLLGIPVDNFLLTLSNNGLTLSIPSPSAFDSFIRMMARDGLLPKEIADLLAKDAHEDQCGLKRGRKV